MNSIHVRNAERTDRVISFIDSLPEDFPEGSNAATLCSQMKQERARLAELDVIRSSSMSKQRQATASRQNVHKLLSSLVRKVVSTADLIALDNHNFEGMFVRPQRNSSGQTLIADARSIAEKAASLVSLFTKNSLPATFINDLRSYADSLEHAMQLQTEAVGERVAANAEIEQVIRRLSGLVERLDVNIRNQYANNPAKLAAWESARRLEHAPRSNRKAENDAPPSSPQP